MHVHSYMYVLHTEYGVHACRVHMYGCISHHGRRMNFRFVAHRKVGLEICMYACLNDAHIVNFIMLRCRLQDACFTRINEPGFAILSYEENDLNVSS